MRARFVELPEQVARQSGYQEPASLAPLYAVNEFVVDAAGLRKA